MARDLLEPVAWQHRAACLGMPTEQFFSRARAVRKAALAVCETCPVIEECLADAVELGDAGVRGGTTYLTRLLRLRGVTHCGSGHELRDETASVRIKNDARIVCSACKKTMGEALAVVA